MNEQRYRKQKRRRFAVPRGALFILTMMVPGLAYATESYVTNETYVGGDRVCFEGDLFQAKWWAGPQDVPSDVDVVAYPWETPWERLASGAAECAGGNEANRPPSLEASASVLDVDSDGTATVELVATAQDPDGDALEYSWEQIAGTAPPVEIEDEAMATAFVQLPPSAQPLQYAFRVRVSDGADSVTREVTVEQQPVVGNNAPVVVASADVVEVVGAGAVRLSAVGSDDPDGDALTYRWNQVAPAEPQASFDDPSRIDPVATLPEPTRDVAFVFEVHVSDGALSSRAEVEIDQRLATVALGCPSWEDGAVYVGGDQVSWLGSIWEAHWWTRGEEPGTTGPWGVWRAATSDCESSPATDPDPDPEPEENSTTVGDPPVDSGNAVTVYRTDLLADEAALTDGPLMALVKDSIRTRDNEAVEAVVPGREANPENVRRVESIIDAERWDFFFPRRAPEYTYESFLRAIAKFPAFCGLYDDGRDADAICRKALATMFAHFTQETGGHTIAWPEPQWRQGLVYVRELGWSEEASGGYGICDTSTWQGATWPCAVFPEGHPSAGAYKSYFGRGAKQLSYNYNYGPFSQAMFGDVSVLLEEPQLVADTWLNLASAVFFYVYPQPPKPSMLHALDGTWVPNEHDLAGGLEPGFGVTTQIINGGIECGGSSEHQQSANRIEYYRNFARELGVEIVPDEVLGCANMQRFDTQGSGALAIYWEQDWTRPNACQLVSYQTPFSAFTGGDYEKCVEAYFDVVVVDDVG